jgi:hypothetical protein
MQYTLGILYDPLKKSKDCHSIVQRTLVTTIVKIEGILYLTALNFFSIKHNSEAERPSWENCLDHIKKGMLESF